MTPIPYDPPPELETVQRRCLLIGIGGMVVCIIGLFFSPAQFFRSYLLGYVFWIGIALGCLAIIMVHHLSGGAWGLVIRRLLESGTRTLPLMFLLFIPIALGVQNIYSWAVSANVAGSELLQHKSSYLNIAFFLIRSILYFAAWLALTHYLNKWSEEQDRTADPNLTRRFENLSGARTRALWSDRDLCRRRLGDVTRTRVVLNHLRRSLHRAARPCLPWRS